MVIQVQIDLVLDEFNLSADIVIPDKGITGVFGESGSGKTTLARTIAGLEQTAVGLVRFGDSLWQDTDQNLFIHTYERGVGFVFQDSILFPHLSVRENLEFGYERIKAATPVFQMDHIVELFDLANLLERSPANLSGGQIQRAVIAQAILGQPQLLIMDEPMTGLDHRRRRDLVLHIIKLHEMLQLPILYITHSIRELERLATNLVTVENGMARNVLNANDYIRNLKQEDFWI